MEARVTAWGALLRTLKLQLAELGFSSDGPRYYLRSDAGDFAVIEMEQSVSGWAGGANEFFVNLAVVPAPWLDWMRTRFPHARSSWTRCPDHASGMWRERLPEPTSTWEVWTLTDHTADGGTTTANAVARAVRSHAAPLLRTLLIRGNLLAEVENTWAYRAALLVDARPSELPVLLEQCDHPDRQVDFIAWLNRYAAGERMARPRPSDLRMWPTASGHGVRATPGGGAPPYDPDHDADPSADAG
jgi:hypothetical protein